MLREIRPVEQRSGELRKRWFQDDYFDLFVWQDAAEGIQRFQLCYARDTRRERALEWRRGRGFQHLRVRQRYEEQHGREQSGEMALDGVLPYREVKDRLEDAAPGLPSGIKGFVEEKLREYARPARKLTRPGRQTPAWLLRLRRES